MTAPGRRLPAGSSTSTRTRAKRAFVAAAGGAALLPAARRRLLRWGATDAEIAAVQPGDELIPDANVTATRAITIHRSPEVVWRWVVQLGQGR
jgi:hypothetical protein